jgi:hypothetical protein
MRTQEFLLQHSLQESAEGRRLLGTHELQLALKDKETRNEFIIAAFGATAGGQITQKTADALLKKVDAALAHTNTAIGVLAGINTDQSFDKMLRMHKQLADAMATSGQGPEAMQKALDAVAAEAQGMARVALENVKAKEAPLTPPKAPTSEYESELIGQSVALNVDEKRLAQALRTTKIGVDVAELSYEQATAVQNAYNEKSKTPVVYSSYEKRFVPLPDSVSVTNGLSSGQAGRAEDLLRAFTETGVLLSGPRSTHFKFNSRLQGARLLDRMWVRADELGWTGASSDKTTESIRDLIRFLAVEDISHVFKEMAK